MDTFLASDGLRLRYVVDDFTDPWRASETLVLLHAAMGSSTRFYAWVPHLCRHFRVVRLDQRGHGQSEIPRAPEELTIERLAADVIELLDHLGCERVHLAGSSAGAIIAQQVTLTYPARIRSLAIFAAAAGLTPSNVDYGKWVATIKALGVRGFLAESIRDRVDPARTDPGFVEWFLDESGKTSPKLLALFVPMMGGVDLRDRLGEIRCPTLVVVPGGDPIHSVSQYEVLRERIANVEFVVYESLAHNITDYAADRCAEELKRFLLRHSQCAVVGAVRGA